MKKHKKTHPSVLEGEDDIMQALVKEYDQKIAQIATSEIPLWVDNLYT